MHPLKIITLALLVFVIVRLFLPLPRRPKWSALIPAAAFVTSVLHFVFVGTDIEMMPAFLLALLATIGAMRDLFFDKTEDDRTWPPLLATSARIASLGAAIVLFTLSSLAAFVWSKSDPVIRGPEPLPSAHWVSGHTTNPALTVVADHPFLRTPRDLAFNPRVEGQLWVVNGGDNSVAILHNAHTTPSIEYRRDGHAAHFMHRPSAIAFGSDDTTIGRPGAFATSQESHDDSIPFMARNFMGPTLFSSDLAVFAHHPGPGRSGSHLDMLHESPLAMGIVWERDHVYWVFGGYLGNIVRYDFVEDHGIGNHDHTNGIIRHYGQHMLRRVPGVPSHLALHRATNTLFIADTGNQRILALDITSGRPGSLGPGWEEGVDTRIMEDVAFAEVVAAGALLQPSGLELKDDLLYVSDHATGLIHVFDLNGVPVTSFDTGLGQGALMGMTFGPDDLLYLVDAASNRILRLDPSLAFELAQVPAVRPVEFSPSQIAGGDVHALHLHHHGH